MRIISSTDRDALEQLANRDAARDAEITRQAAGIVNDVRYRGDAALVEWTRKLDRRAGEAVDLTPIGRAAMKRGWSETPKAVRTAIRTAARHLARVAARQVPRGTTVRLGPGHRVEQRVQPLARVGCYVPGGRHPLPSTLIMTVVPARAAYSHSASDGSR